MKTKYSSGPWKAIINKEGAAPHFIKNESGQLLIATVHLDTLQQETISNAKLISAAPELLENLEQCLVCLQVLDPKNPSIKMAEKAIKKAIGK